MTPAHEIKLMKSNKKKRQLLLDLRLFHFAYLLHHFLLISYTPTTVLFHKLPSWIENVLHAYD